MDENRTTLKLRLVCGKCNSKKMFPVADCGGPLPVCCKQSMLILGDAPCPQGPVYQTPSVLVRTRYVKGTETPDGYTKGPYRREPERQTCKAVVA